MSANGAHANVKIDASDHVEASVNTKSRCFASRPRQRLAPRPLIGAIAIVIVVTLQNMATSMSMSTPPPTPTPNGNCPTTDHG
jgi:hypothetical protein